MRPDVDHLVVALLVGDDALLVLPLDLADLVQGLLDLLLLLGGHDHVVDADRDAGAGGLLESDLLELVEGRDRALMAHGLVAVEDEVAQLALAHHEVGEAQLGRPDLGEDDAAHGGLDDVVGRVAVDGLLAEVRVLHTHAVVRLQAAVHQGEDDLLLGSAQDDALALLPGLAGLGGEVVAAQGDVLGRRHDGLAARRAEDVQRRHHEEARLQLGLDRQRHVHGHLVAVEVRVVGGADERMDADGLALDEDRLEGLHRQAVQGRSAVEQHRMPAGDLLEDVPDLLGLTLDHLLGRADRVDVAELLEAADDEGLEEHQRHLLGKTALVELQFRSDDDDRTAGVVDALAQQVLAEAARLALEHVGERLEGPIAGTRDRTAVATVVEQGVDGLLQHALLVPDDDLRSLELEQVLEAVVAVDDPAIQIVEVGGREAATLERHQRAQVGGDDGQHREDHPLGAHHRFGEALEELDPLGDLLAVLLRLGLGHGDLELLDGLVELQVGQGVVDRLGTHLGHEGVVTVGGPGLAILVLGEELVGLQRGAAGIDDQVVLVVDHPLQVARRHVEHQADAGRHALEEPDVGDGHRELDVAHALATDAGQCHLDAAAVADHAAVLDALVLAAGALPVLDRTEDALAEEPTLLGLECAVVDGLGVLDLTLRPGADGLRRRDLDRDVVHQVHLVQAQQLAGGILGAQHSSYAFGR